MATLYAVGNRYDRMITVSGITSTSDGYTWTSADAIENPFLIRQSAIGITTDGATVAVISDDGYVSCSYNGNAWVNGSIIDADFSPRAIRYATDSTNNNPAWMVVGTQKYATTEPAYNRYDEVAQILKSDNGNQSSWLMVYTQDDNNSVFHGIRRIGDAWIACGVSYNNPLILYSLDNGFSWVSVGVPSIFDGCTVFDVTYANELYVFAASGVILYTPDLVTPEWNATDFVTETYANADFTRIAVNPSGHVVAVASGMIYYTLDGADWDRYENPGYQFSSVVWFNDRWIVGTYGLLTRNTCFVSTDTKTWIGDNNSMHMYDFAIAS